MLIWPSKDADEAQAYSLDWHERMGGGHITSATFTVASGDVALSEAEHDGARLSHVLVSGGTNGTKAKILCEIETGDGQTLQETATLVIKAR